MTGETRQRVGDYEILGILGAGGMGRVYRVRNTISDRIEAMKILLPDLAGRKDLADRFLREIKLVASLNHPNIATLCTALTIDNQLVMVMEFVEGVTLTQLLESGPIRIPDALDYLDQGLAALGYAHSKGIIHRDIKPANMMLTPTGVVKLMDFGIAHADTQRALTQTGTTLGSIDYMSPEQILGQNTDARSDLYSIGVSLYEMVTGQRPFRASSDFELMAAHVKDVPKNPIEIQPWMPARLSEIIMKTIAKAPEDRYQHAEDLRQALRTVTLTPGSSQLTMMEPSMLTMVEDVPTPVPKSRFPTFVEDRPATVVENRPATIAENRPPTFADNRPATFVENRPATMVESRPGAFSQSHPQTMLVNNARDNRGMTEVAGTPVFNPPPPSALAVRGKKNHAIVYAVCGTAVVMAVAAVPILRMTRSSADAKSKPPAIVAEKTVPPATPAPVVPAPGGRHPAALPPGLARPQPPNLSLPRGTRPGQPTNLTASGTAVVVLPGKSAPEAPKMSAEQKNKLDELEPQIDQLSNRAAAVNNSLNTMQRSMQKDGLGLRGDIVVKQSSMNNNLSKARQALSAQDPDRASRFAALTEPDVKALETFLGR